MLDREHERGGRGGSSTQTCCWADGGAACLNSTVLFAPSQRFFRSRTPHPSITLPLSFPARYFFREALYFLTNVQRCSVRLLLLFVLLPWYKTCFQ